MLKGSEYAVYLNTPFGKVIVLVDDYEYPYTFIEKESNNRLYPDVLGCYRIQVNFEPDGKNHEIKCIIPNIKYIDREPESGEALES